MRLIYVTVSFPLSGREAFFIPEVRELLRQGHEVLIVPRSPRKRVLHRDALSLLGNTLAEPLLSFAVLRSAFLVVFQNPGSCLRTLAMIFHSRNFGSFLKNLAVFPKGLWLSRVARSWHPDHIHAQWASTTALMAMVAGEVTGIGWSFTAHRLDIIANNLLQVKIAKARYVRFISRNGERMARELGVSTSNGKQRIIHMGVQLSSTTPGGKRGNGMPCILCPASLISRKGHRFLLEAIAVLKNRGIAVSLRLAGDGELKGELHRQATALLVDGEVRFLGQVPHDALMDFYKNGEIDIVVLPSVDVKEGEPEGIPVSLIEAMNYGIPVISTTTGGIPELLSEGAGLLVPPGVVIPLADAIELLLRDEKVRSQLTERGRRRVMEEFDVKRVVAELADCCTSS